MAQAAISTINFSLEQKLTSIHGGQYQTRILGEYDPQNSLVNLRYLGFANFKDLQVPNRTPEDHLYHHVVVEVSRKCGTKIRINNTEFYITSQGKTLGKKFLAPDLILAQEILKSLEEVTRLYPGYISGFHRRHEFTHAMTTEIIAYFRTKAEVFAKAKAAQAYKIPRRYWGLIHNVEDRNKVLGMWRTAESVAKGHDDRPFGGRPRATRTILVDGHTIDWSKLDHNYWGHALWGFPSPILAIWASKTGWIYAHLKNGTNQVLSTSWEDPTETMNFLESCVLQESNIDIMINRISMDLGISISEAENLLLNKEVAFDAKTGRYYQINPQCEGYIGWGVPKVLKGTTLSLVSKGHSHLW